MTGKILSTDDIIDELEVTLTTTSSTSTNGSPETDGSPDPVIDTSSRDGDDDNNDQDIAGVGEPGNRSPDQLDPI